MSACILIVDDEAAIRDALRDLFEDEGYLVGSAASGEEALAWLARRQADCVLLDIWLPGIDGIETLARIRELDPHLPVIVMSGHATIDAAVEATRKGAFDFLEKPLATERLLVQVRNALRQRQLALENLSLREDASDVDLVGQSPAIEELRAWIDKAAATPAPVLIVGEHGVGKQLVARVLHARSARADGPFVVVQAAGLSEEEAERALFGWARGAFVGADQAQRGFLERAHRGTLFIDGLHELPASAQVRLVEALKARRVRPIGAMQTFAADVRAIASVPEDAEALVRKGLLRPEARYFFGVLTLHVPPLRKRREDVPLLVQRLAKDVATELGLEMVRFAPDAIAAMREHDWPGNVRELRNYIERCTILAPGKTLAKADLPPMDGSEATIAKDWLQADFRTAKEAFERAYLLHHLEQNGWNISRTARATGIERSQLHRKLTKLGILVPKEKSA